MGQSPKQYKLSNNKQFTIKDSIKYRKYYQTFVLGSGAFLIAFLISSVFSPVQNSDAAQLVNIENTNTGYYVNVSGSAAINVSTTTTPEGSLFGAKDTITTTTNSPRGYQLYISASPNYLYLNGDSSTSNQGKFSPIGGDITSAVSLGSNTWGFAFDNSATGVSSNNFPAASSYSGTASETDDTIIPTSSATYASVPTTAKMIQQISSANEPNGTDLPIYYGFKATTSLPSGSYQGAVTYTVISDGVNNNATFMQDFTTAECQALPTATKDNYATAHVDLIDKRDMKWYSVAKMADGNCWMTSNLALDGTDSSGAVRTLTPDDSNVSENRTLAKNIESGAPSNNTDIQIFSGVAENATIKCNENYPYCVESNVKYGNLYNWIAATAGAGSAETTTTTFESVCPKGWRLPDNGGNGVDKSFGNLLAKSGVGTGENVEAGEAGGVLVEKTQQAPLYFALTGGYYSDGAIYNSGREVRYWSRTPYVDASTNAYTLYLSSANGSFSPRAASGKSNGFPVRCVFYGNDVSNITYMQDMTTDICEAMSVGDTKKLYDARGNYSAGSENSGYGIVKAKDGNCWMTDNFNLYDKTIYAGASDFSTDSYAIPGVSDTGWSGNIYNEPKAHRVTATSKSNISGDAKKPYIGQVYYNWTAAVALNDGSTTEQQNQSICPKNWQLPVDSTETVDKSWAKLLGSTYGYGITSGAQLLDSNNPTYALGFHDYYGIWDWDQTSEWNQGTHSFVWTSTPTSETRARSLSYHASGIDLRSYDNKGYGFSVRCVAR